MVFSSLVFIYLFLPISLILYFISKNQTYRNAILIILSLAFYAWGEPVWITIMIFSATIDYYHGLIVEKYRGKWQSKAALISSITINLFILILFKYTGFIIQNIEYIMNVKIPYTGFNLPIGISFYTFQTISYVVDVYRGEVEAQKSPFKMLLFVSLFHQLVAGPIVRYKDIAYDIDNRKITAKTFNQGINRFLVGLSKKVIIANNVGGISELFLKSELTDLTVLGSWLGIFLFALQIYFDFSGYSDMAIGLGKMFGFNYKENFNYPYISKSATEFWRRWHMSLGSFFRDYVYIPLGGNRKYEARNLLIVWFLTGLWHGASWNFIAWGLYYFVLIFFERAVFSNILKRIPSIFSHIYLVFAVTVGWVFFYFTDLGHAFKYIGIMFGYGNSQLVDTYFKINFANNIYIILLATIACTPFLKNVHKYINLLLSKKSILHDGYMQVGRPLLNLTMLAISTILLIGMTYNPFLYFRF
ncbi:alginate O-acetyltransferase complex protein AlgI [Proteiniborus ethanoligenes]|uniref:Alginate O-acetyltransferase complex protein AlgI n=1 Tax=Proteiniborus ethanoligenes TaxID=415015 RepID=A0A1H3MXD3_9FIRM|nr:MBOAT family O-acyltransferase [Proteiniborus ethanoligenes]TAH63704.1 MAG: MBOAT family protein [Gottschalkiaceae bacterium]SDY81168.1 alginate O-acetyltransferase complex protein AlgI [Proteiniborus ethanoligenes]